MNDDDALLPEGWTKRPLGDVLRLQNGYAFKASQWSTSGLPIIRIQNLNSRAAAFNHFAGELPERFRARSGDLLFAWSGTPGTSFGAHVWSDGDAWINQHIFRVDFSSEDYDREFLRLALNANLNGYISGAHGGVGLAHITKSKLNESLLLSPPLEVQRQIAGFVTAANANALEAARRVRSARKSVDRFRQAVLAAACVGRLTADWRNEHPARESAADLVRAIESGRRARLGGRFKPLSAPQMDTELPDGWVWTKVGSLVEVATGATPLRSRADFYGGDVPWVTSGGVNAGLITEPAEFITDVALRETNAKVFPSGTLLVAMYGEGQTRGRVGELGLAAATNQAVAALVFDAQTTQLRDYLRIFFQENYERIRQLSFGGVQPNLSLGVIRDTPVPVPPADEQIEIVLRVSRLMRDASAVVARIDVAGRRVDHTLQAILAKAFRGELTGSDRASG